jgi:LysM repeat protein
LTNRCKDDVPCSEADHQLNRRTEFKVIAYSQPSGRGQFDPSKFKDGDVFESRLLPDYFFEPCLLEVSNSPVEVITPQQQAVIPVKQTVIPQKEVINKSSDAWHVVEPGETLYRIAKNNDLTVEKLKQLNNLTDDKIRSGQKLKLR